MHLWVLSRFVDNWVVRIRSISPASGKHAIQVVSGGGNNQLVHSHIGTYSTPLEKQALLLKAAQYIKQTSKQIGLFDREEPVKLADVSVSQNQPLFLYRLLTGVYRTLGLNSCPDPVIADLVVARLYKPVSKRSTQKLLTDSFAKPYSLITLYRHLKSAMESGVKEAFQTALISFAQGNTFTDGLRLVFYDVTTLYFESTVKTGLRGFGFSKDHRHQQTQVVVGLVVNSQGFPVYFDVFTGNTFEGHTFLPVIRNIRTLLNQPELVVIADAAMLSTANMDELHKNRLNFVVGARLANLPNSLLETVTTDLSGHENSVGEFDYRGYRLICQYSKSRAAKDRSDRLRQVTKAETIISQPAGATNRFRFVKKSSGIGPSFVINQELVSRAEKLEGIKGYLTNTSLEPAQIIDRYHDLWRIEKAFRITKSDLEARPVFHRLDQTIKAHLVIVFAALAISRYLEIKTGLSIGRIIEAAGKLLTHRIENTKTGETIYSETTIHDPQVLTILAKLKSLGY